MPRFFPSLNTVVTCQKLINLCGTQRYIWSKLVMYVVDYGPHMHQITVKFKRLKDQEVAWGETWGRG